MDDFSWDNYLSFVDHPDTWRDLGEGTDREPEPADGLSGSLRMIWDRLSPRTPLRIASVSAAHAQGAILLIGEADKSQFDILCRLQGAETDGLKMPIVVNAARGRKFHGNRGRPWQAAQGNIHLSALFPCDFEMAGRGTLISATACLSVCDAVEASTKGVVTPEIKWVNDVRIGQAKMAGILTAARVEEGRIRSVVFGIGMNVLAEPRGVEPSAFVPAISHLSAHAPNVSLSDAWAGLVHGLSRRFRELMETPERIVNDYRARSALAGRRVRLYAEDVTNQMETLRAAKPLMQGTVERLDDSLGIVFRGSPKIWTSGRLAYEEECVAIGLE